MDITISGNMRDNEIRACLLKSLERRYKDDADTLIIQELGLCQGDARIDLAVVNGSLHGYEIKSEKDTLRRLAGQLDVYGKVLDFVTLVASPRHLLKVVQIVPVWWGICEAHYKKGHLTIKKVRPSQENNDIDSTALVQLLWRGEALEVLKERNLHKGIVNKSRLILWDRITECLSLNEIREEVRKRIKARQGWRVVSQQLSCDD